MFEPKQIGKQMIGFGFNAPRWQRTAFFESPSIGRMPAQNTTFDPRAWKPRVPNQAFLHARPDDQFWAAQKLMALSADMIRAAVATGEFNDPQAEAFLVQALIERRDAIGRTFLTGVNPIANPALTAAGTLTFTNAAVEADFARAPREYHAVWSSFDNTTGDTRVIGVSTSGTTTMTAPVTLPAREGSFLKIEMSSDGSLFDSWSTPVHVFFRLTNGAWELVGFERQPGC